MTGNCEEKLKEHRDKCVFKEACKKLTQRQEATKLTDEELDDELQRGLTYWNEDVNREALRRILLKLNKLEKD